MKQLKQISVATWFVIALVIAFAVGAFVMSFDAVESEAVRLGFNPALAWLLPFMYDGFIVLFGIGSIWAKMNEGKGYRYATAFILIATGLTVWLNISHAPQLDALHIMVFATPPLALAITFHFLIIMLEHTAAKLQDESKEVQELTRLLQDHDNLKNEVATLNTRLATANQELETERANIATLVQEHTAELQVVKAKLQAKADKLQEQLNKAQQAEKILQETGVGTMDTILVMANCYNGTQAEFAAAYDGFTAPVVSKLKKSLNGGVADPFKYLIEHAVKGA